MLGVENSTLAAPVKGKTLDLSPHDPLRVDALAVMCSDKGKDGTFDAILLIRDDRIQDMMNTIRATREDQSFIAVMNVVVGKIRHGTAWGHVNMLSGGTSKIADVDRHGPAIYKILCPHVAGGGRLTSYLVHRRRVVNGAHKWLVPHNGYRFLTLGPSDLAGLL